MKAIDWAFRSRETGRIVIAQFPNVALWVFIVAAGSRRLLDPGTPWSTALEVIAWIAILWWAVDELVRGVNPWRRFLGSAVLVLELAALVR